LILRRINTNLFLTGGEEMRRHQPAPGGGDELLVFSGGPAQSAAHEAGKGCGSENGVTDQSRNRAIKVLWSGFR